MALDWSIQEAMEGLHVKATLGFVCDVAALWLQRGGAVELLLSSVPLLVKAMATCPEDVPQLKKAQTETYQINFEQSWEAP